MVVTRTQVERAMKKSRVPPDIVHAVVRRVVYGDYGSVEAVLRAALASLDETEAATASTAEVREAIATALLRNEAKPVVSADEVIADFEQVFAELEARRAAGIERLRAEILVGLAELDAGRGVDGEEALRRIRARFENHLKRN